MVTERATDADLFYYGTATHYIPAGGNIWTVVGTYDFHLIKSGADWRVDRITFTLKYQDGNLNLPKPAGDRAKEPT